jgi:hypothetical protein
MSNIIKRAREKKLVPDVGARFGFADGSMYLKRFVDKNLSTNRGGKRLNMYLVEERATPTTSTKHPHVVVIRNTIHR